MRRTLSTLVVGALAVVLGYAGVAAATGEASSSSLTCPATLTDDGMSSSLTFTAACDVPRPAPLTETATVTETTTATATVTATPDPEPVALRGGSYGGADESRYAGRAEVARIFFTGGLPTDVTNAAFDQAYADGVRTFVISWKGTQTQAQVEASLSSLPADVTVYGTYWHEPEDNIGGTITLAQWRQRTIENAAAMRAEGVIPTVILMQWTLNPNSGRDFMDYAFPAGTIDVAGWDYYMNPAKGKDDPEGAVDDMVAASRAMNVPATAIAETGVPSSVDQATAVDLVTRLRAKVLTTPDFPWATYWSSGDFAFTDGTAAAWFG